MSLDIGIQSRDSFYKKCVLKRIPLDASILIVGAGEHDRNVFYSMGYRNVVISNIDIRQNETSFLPYSYKRLDLSNLECPDNSFDFVVTHACLHHCSSPHKGLLEMYRVSRRGVVIIESRDSLVIRLLQFFKITETYELSAVYYNDGKFGGLNNSNIPNYIYRWTEREVIKTISTYDPSHAIDVYFDYGLSFPASINFEISRIRRFFLFAICVLYRLLSVFLYKQQNLFSFFIDKHNRRTFPWVSLKK